jgi:hypothetical protein
MYPYEAVRPAGKGLRSPGTRSAFDALIGLLTFEQQLRLTGNPEVRLRFGDFIDG